MASHLARIDTRRVCYPVVGSFQYLAATSASRPTRDTILVRVEDQAGQVGWGQCVPSASWSYETLESVQSTLELYLGPALLGVDPSDQETVERILHRTIAPSFSTGQPLCKAGLDLALFDLNCRVAGLSAYERWGKPRGRGVTLSWTVDVSEPSAVAGVVESARQRGFQHFNVKIGWGVARDTAICRELRQLAPSSFIWVDANGKYDLDSALQLAPQLAELNIAAWEQPLPANCLSGYRRLRLQRALPILLDEGVVSLTDLREFHQLDLLDGVAMKVARCGGLTTAVLMAEYLREHDLLFYASGLTDPDVSLAASLLYFDAWGLEYPAALNAPQFLTGTILKQPVTICGDQAIPPSGLGLGVEVCERLEEGGGRLEAGGGRLEAEG